MRFVVSAYFLWGLFPAFFPLLIPAGPVEILAHRILWCAALMTSFLVLTRRWGSLTRLPRKTWLRLALAGVLITVNWGVYVFAVNTGHVADAAMGYFINPLVSVAIGVALFREQLRRLQRWAIAIAGFGVLWFTFLTGQPPVIALGVALSFGFYGAVKKLVDVPSAVSLTAETLIVAPLAMAYLAFLHFTGSGTFGSVSVGHSALLALSGAITAAPLFLFGAGAKQLPLSTVGMLQYITPTMAMMWAVFVAHEPQSVERWIGFAIIWVAVGVYLADLATRSRKVTTRRTGEA